MQVMCHIVHYSPRPVNGPTFLLLTPEMRGQVEEGGTFTAA